ncbi:hypothetical protein [Burkholderia sp. BCC1630]|uniref:hypothetical protein n=1 Tax=Burkholderia sp. BCC1630 TaxID=2676304 RepID=UPI00158A400D|nr:hypothetical protein [Burkholderia sp. BCC1630]
MTVSKGVRVAVSNLLNQPPPTRASAPLARSLQSVSRAPNTDPAALRPSQAGKRSPVAGWSKEKRPDHAWARSFIHDFVGVNRRIAEFETGTAFARP